VTISESGAIDLAAAPSDAVHREAAGRVLEYLIFHRSLLGETEAPADLLDRYMGLVHRLKDGVHVIIPDPYQKATAILFELVMQEEFDPWEIDLARFTQSYLERVRSEGGVDFAVAGRLLYMAWSILYLQSEELLRNREPPPEPAAGEGAPLEDGYLSDMETPEALDVTSVVVGSTDPPPLVPMVRHAETRPVSLLELVRAFGEAEQEARRSLQIQQLRERLREEQRAPPEVLVHGDIPERDLSDAWEIALTHAKGEPFPMLDLWRPTWGRDRLVALFLACLFLARERVVELRQERLGDGPIHLVRVADTRAPVAEA